MSASVRSARLGKGSKIQRIFQFLAAWLPNVINGFKLESLNCPLGLAKAIQCAQPC